MSGTSNEDESIVVPAVTAPSSVCLLRSLGRRGVHTVAVSEREDVPALFSKYCDERVAAPSPFEDSVGYRDVLLELAEREDVRTIVPVREQDIYVLSKYRASFAPHIETPWLEYDALSRVHDRIELDDAARAAGVPVPGTRLLDEVDEWDRPQIVKGRYAIVTPEFNPAVPEGTCSSPPKTIFLEPGVEPDVETIVDEMGHVPVVQEYVPGTEYTFRGIYERGTPLVTTLKRLHRGMKYSRGPSVCHEITTDPELEADGRALMEELDWTGLASVGFIEDSRTGEFTLLEVNPRLWGNVVLDVHAGIDTPYYYWQFSAGELEPVDPATVDLGVTSHLLRGEASYLHSVLREEYPLVERPSFHSALWEVARSLVAQPRFDLFSLDDPEPFFRDVAGSISDLRRRTGTTPSGGVSTPSMETRNL